MKKKRVARRAPTSGLITGARTVEEYLAAVPEPARSTLKKVRAVIRAVVPKEATEVISYQIPMFKYKGMLFGFAAFQKHCSLFPTNASLIAQYKNELKPFSTARGTIRFPLDKPFPAPLLKKLVKARVAENELKKKS
jgi:uncharacterized protein YdhG (YjbR/CyaY superfamily)